MNLLSKRPFILIAVALFALPIGLSFYKYYFLKDYDYLIEAECDVKNEICYSRDCSNQDDCPPNGLSIYKIYYVKAYDFAKCSDNSCENECGSRLIECTPVPCGDSNDDICTQPLL